MSVWESLFFSRIFSSIRILFSEANALCEQEQKMIDRYELAAAYCWVRNADLDTARGLASSEELQALSLVAEHARLACNFARLALEHHASEHGC